MNSTQCIRVILLGSAVGGFVKATTSRGDVAMHAIAFGLLFWCISVIIKVGKAGEGVFF